MKGLLIRRLAATAGAAAVLPFLATGGNASGGAGGPAPIVVPDSAVTPTTLALGGAKVLPTTRTVAHWHGSATSPVDGVTYGFNMVGADPSANQSTTITTDIIPVNVVVGGMAFNGTNVLAPTLNSPQFANQDYSSTPWVTSSAGGFTAAGTLSPASNGNAVVQTYAWASYITPGFFNPNTGWAVQDIHALSHEISEWADDPFVNNTVQPWLTPTAPQYGCTGVLETGDPVVGIGFAKGSNTFEQGPTPNGTQVADGYYHPEDEVFMPWFMRLSPSPAETGRETPWGHPNPYPGFKG